MQIYTKYIHYIYLKVDLILLGYIVHTVYCIQKTCTSSERKFSEMPNVRARARLIHSNYSSEQYSLHS